MQTKRFTHPRTQRGAVLIVALVLLLVLTVLGTAGIRDTAMEERMAGNFRDYAAAIEAAESALRTGEAGIASQSVYVGYTFDGSGGTYDVHPSTVSVSPDDPGKYGLSVPSSVLTYGGDLLVNAVPEYYIERLPQIDMPGSDISEGTQEQPPVIRYHRITAKGFGISPNTEVILQSTYFDWETVD